MTTSNTPAPKAVEALPELLGLLDGKHSPGPWIHYPEDNMIATDDGRGLLEWQARSLNVSVEERDANARLVAAAPALLAALAALATLAAAQAKPIVLTGAQLVEAADFIVPDRDDPDQLKDEARLQFGAGHSGEGWYISFDEMPEEGSMLLDGPTAALSPQLPSPDVERQAVAWMSQCGSVARSQRYFEERGIADLTPLYATPPQEAGDADAESLARRFHDTYERLAPSFGYETRPDTKAFDPTSANGRLMIAVCAALTARSPQQEPKA